SIARNSMGVAYKNMGDIDRAIEEYKRAVEIDETYYKAYNNLGVAFYKKSFFDEAQKYFKKALEINPNYAVAKKNLEAAEKKDAVFTETIMKLEQKANEVRENTAIYFDLGKTYRSTGHLENAIVQYQKVIQLEPDNIEALNNIGTVYYELGQYDNAINSFITVISKDSR